MVRDGGSCNGVDHAGAKHILGLDRNESNVKQGTGQLTTFKQLGFSGSGSNHKPDGWFLPKDTSKVALILETKSSDKDINCTEYIDELLFNVRFVRKAYNRVVGILYNGCDAKIFLNEDERGDITSVLQQKEFYFNLFNDFEIDSNQIYLVTMKINNLLHYKFGMNDYYSRMVFTACALVAKRYGAVFYKGMNYENFSFTILDMLRRSLSDTQKLNEKLQILIDIYSAIQVNNSKNQDAIDNFIDHIEVISELVNSRNWNGEDVMGIFFNEFNRYKGKSENGQIFTPEHITSLMYKLVNVTPTKDRILDAACGSGAFLTKSMSMMLNAVGGADTSEGKNVMTQQLYGIEMDKRIFSLACANMLIHKDGKSNLEQMDSTTKEACDWIKSKNITRVLMNPPYERKSHPEIIVKNVLDNVEPHSICAFLLPDKKLEKTSQKIVKDILKRHRLLKIIKISEKTFDEGVSTSIFIFESAIPQNDEEIFTCYIKDDGLERVKNQGRKDIKHKWKEIEEKWVDIIKKQSGDDSIKWIKPKEHLSYQKDEIPFEVYENNFIKTMTDYLLFKEDIDIKSLKDGIANKVFYFSDIVSENDANTVSIAIDKRAEHE